MDLAIRARNSQLTFGELRQFVEEAADRGAADEAVIRVETILEFTATVRVSRLIVEDPGA